ncbi:MAG: hypothetical protein NT166_00290 [Candidatus Aminicenantes bacterium]|nr:hypothetical protein [Candidatus Aminicenantes bacterium]
MDFVKIKAPLTAKGNTLAWSNRCIEIYAYSQDHRFHQTVLYLKSQPKSIPKFNQRFNGISTNNQTLERYIIAFDWPNAGESIRQLSEPSLYDVTQAWRMISFWVETPFWVSSNLAHELHELPRIKKTFVHVWRLHRFTLISIFRRGRPPCLPFPPCSPAYHSLINHQSYNKLSQAQSIRPDKVILHEKSPKPAQGMIHTLSLAPQGVRADSSYFIFAKSNKEKL